MLWDGLGYGDVVGAMSCGLWVLGLSEWVLGILDGLGNGWNRLWLWDFRGL